MYCLALQFIMPTFSISHTMKAQNKHATHLQHSINTCDDGPVTAGPNGAYLQHDHYYSSIRKCNKAMEITKYPQTYAIRL